MEFCIAFLVLLTSFFTSPLILFFRYEDSNTCPFCYDDQFCDAYQNNLTSRTLYSYEYLLNYFISKPINHATYDNKPVVIKTLATAKEYEQLDMRAKEVFGNNFSCNDSQIDKVYSEIISVLNKSVDEITKIKICPNLDNVQLLFKGYNFSSCDSLLHLWTAMLLNPEPIVLQMFRAEDHWPVPIYYGSCNRRSVVEDGGKTLSHYVDKPWQTRLYLVRELIQLALNFTSVNYQLALYLTDLTLDNISVDQHLKIRVIDLEHVIIVQKRARFDILFGFHSSKHFDTVGLTYSADAICSHRISDHNVYAVCKEFLHSSNSDLGLLKGTPKNILQAYEIDKLVRECINPTVEDPGFVTARFIASINLVTRLSQIIKDYGIQN